MDSIKSMVKQSSHYYLSRMLTMICGFVSFPVLTRILTKEEYGILSLITISIYVVASSSKFGLQHAALRFYSEFKEKWEMGGLKTYYSTIVKGNILISILIGVIYIIIFYYIGGILHEEENEIFIYCIIVLGVMTSIIGTNLNIISAMQKTKLRMKIDVISAYSSFTLAIFFVFVMFLKLKGIVLGSLIVNISLVFFLFFILRRDFKYEEGSFSLIFLKRAILYGLPMVGFELMSNLLSFGDRYFIQYFMGSASVGIYSAGYNLCQVVADSFTGPLSLAIIPMYLKIWETKGAEETSKFLNKMIKIIFMIGIPIVFGMVHLKEDIVVILASKKFESASKIIPYIIPSLIIYSLTNITGAGLTIHKKTSYFLILTIMAGILNTGLNLVLIPKFGLEGAAVATLIAYLFLSSILYYVSKKYLEVSIPLWSIIRYAAISSLMVYVLSFMKAGSICDVILKVVMGVSIYSAGVMLLDREVRTMSIHVLKSSSIIQRTYKTLFSRL